MMMIVSRLLSLLNLKSRLRPPNKPFFGRGEGCRWIRGLRAQNPCAIGIQPVHTRVDSRGLQWTPATGDSDHERRRARLEVMTAVLAEIDAACAAFAREENIPGLIAAIVQGGRLAHVTAFGRADIEASRPVTPDTAFRIASMTKSTTALAILAL